ncbi:antibiotic biosynthesis monooxygenase [Panacibacter ginsenosidivorans]|uniref:Antibiotic biosynthesis monooxygenase n=1 Tax=Panacibacter ginsenosidivorans TaxID=1813871 RepID=A0A5B8VEL2_9BACT|nr:antibiotic biosynthesis monooxygenase [Panacibacter ginsenosidivorans]QEC69483.1 antibiotic biosynthesis monooxygenase [Panacibacter ginsenosidivorans]
MFARLTFIGVQSNKMENLRKIFNEEIVPVVKSQKGNLGIWLLEPTNENDDFISLTEWISKADADAYEATGTYRALVDKVKDMYKSKPVLKTYNLAETKIMVNA